MKACFHPEKKKLEEPSLSLEYFTLGVPTNSLPNDKNLRRTEFKAFAGDKSNLVVIMVIVCEDVENHVRKGEVLVICIFFFPFFNVCKVFSLVSLKTFLVW